MKGKRLFLAAQAALCILAAAALAAAAVRMYAEGSAAQAGGDLFAYMFTREKAGAALRALLPLIAAALAMTVVGLILGIRDENADRPVRDEKGLRNFSEAAVSAQADKRTRIIRAVILVIAAAAITAGILNGGLEDVLAKGAAVCTECVGLG